MMIAKDSNIDSDSNIDIDIDIDSVYLLGEDSILVTKL